MLWITLLLLAVLFVIALVMTLQVAKQQNREIESREQRGMTAEDEIQQSQQYETESLRKNIPNLIKIYIGLFVIVLGFIVTILIIL
ncbi:hypothetical protein ACKXGF_03560 [Alkalibacillus sp. S2W]|uniref:hypothetical protein n=1 Tax=Alkalibacillus TaxID=331654 RepID=UPI00142379C1|nr:hypothetical protein [Alkalibacillus almallahensis]NIK11610.1 uncharacterized protein YpmS [Alkalibacillus almallahensis]